METVANILQGVARLSPVFDRLLSALLRLLCAPDEAASEDAAGALVNLSSQDPNVVEALLKLNAVGRVMDYLKEGTCKHPRLLVRWQDRCEHSWRGGNAAELASRDVQRCDAVPARTSYQHGMPVHVHSLGCLQLSCRCIQTVLLCGQPMDVARLATRLAEAACISLHSLCKVSVTPCLVHAGDAPEQPDHQ
jgi:hypothetical protein